MRRAHDLYFHRGVRFDNKLAPTILHDERRVLLQRLNWGAVAATGWFESLAVAQFTCRGGRPLQRRRRQKKIVATS